MPRHTSSTIIHSFILPVHNEATYLRPRLRLLLSLLRQHNYRNFEILLIENGSTDQTWNILQKLRHTQGSLRTLRISQASYGQAIKHGILSARGKYLFILNIDFFDIQFISQAQKLLKKYPVVVGSKTLAGSSDTRGWVRRFGTRWLNRILRTVWRYPGTDTHGLKAFHNTPELIEAVRACSAKHEFFDTQLLVLLSRGKKQIQEIPVNVKEVRPSRYTNWLRFERGIIDAYRLITFSFAHAHTAAKQLKKWPVIADDYGLSPLVNAAILDQAAVGRVDGISILANCILASDAVALRQLKKNRGLQLGLHCNLNRGRPLASRAQVRSLVDARGQFFSLPLFLGKLLIGQIRLSEVEIELAAQYRRLRKLGLLLDYVDSEQHVHTFGPIRGVLSRFAAQNRLKMRSVASTQNYLRPYSPKYAIFLLLQGIFSLTHFRSQKKSFKADIAYNVRITHPGSLYD